MSAAPDRLHASVTRDAVREDLERRMAADPRWVLTDKGETHVRDHYDPHHPADWPDKYTDPEAMEAVRDAAEVRATKRGGGG